MRRTPTEVEVRQIRLMQGKVSAQVAGELFDLGAETVRRIWRRETHRNVVDGAEGTADESINRLGALLSQEPPEGEEGTGDGNIPA